MSKRVTIVLSDETHKKLRLRQAKLITTATTTISFSSMIEDLLIKGLKK